MRLGAFSLIVLTFLASGCSRVTTDDVHRARNDTIDDLQQWVSALQAMRFGRRELRFNYADLGDLLSRNKWFLKDQVLKLHDSWGELYVFRRHLSDDEIVVEL